MVIAKGYLNKNFEEVLLDILTPSILNWHKNYKMCFCCCISLQLTKQKYEILTENILLEI